MLNNLEIVKFLGVVVKLNKLKQTRKVLLHDPVTPRSLHLRFDNICQRWEIIQRLRNKLVIILLINLHVWRHYRFVIPPNFRKFVIRRFTQFIDHAFLSNVNFIAWKLASNIQVVNILEVALYLQQLMVMSRLSHLLNSLMVFLSQFLLQFLFPPSVLELLLFVHFVNVSLANLVILLS